MTYNFIGERARRTPLADANLSPQASLDTGKKGKVQTPCDAYYKMQKSWEIIDAVKGGTQSFREESDRYIPALPFESPAAYARRKDKSSFSPWYLRLTRGLIGMILRKPITFDDLSTEVEEVHLENINLLGDNLDSFVREVLESGVDYGHCGILVESQKTEGQLTIAEQRERGLRPYWIRYDAKDILGGKVILLKDRQILTQLRLRTVENVPVGEFGEEEEERIRVYDRVQSGLTCRIYKPVKGIEEWELAEDPIFVDLPEIPFTVFYGQREGYLRSKPPMLEIAYLNIHHCQASTDLAHSISLVANPKFLLFGYDGEGDDEINLAADRALVFENTNSRAEWSAPSSDSFAAQRDQIHDIELQMQMGAMSAMVSQKNVGESAESKRLDKSPGDSQLAVIAQNLQDCLNNALYYHSLYIGETAGTCQVNRDFDTGKLTSLDIAAYSQLQQLDQLSLETLWEILRRGELLPDDFDPEEELSRLDARQSRLDEVLSDGTDEEDPTEGATPANGGTGGDGSNPT